MILAWILAIPMALIALLLVMALVTWISARHAEKLVPAVGKFIDVPGARLHYVDQGSGPPIVMIHGLGAQLHNFTYGVVEHLTDRYRVICVDRPGAGYSTVTCDTHPDLHGQAAIMAHFIAALRLDRPLLVGHSLGGALSLRLALDHPRSAGALALLSPLTQRQDAIPSAFKALVIASPFVRRLISWTLAVPLGKLGRHKAQAMVFAPEPCPEDFGTKGGNALVLRPGSFFAASSEVSAGSGELIGMMARYPSLEVPVAILFARQDQILDPLVHGDAMSEATPLASLDLIDGGHMFPLTKPAETAAWIDDKAMALSLALQYELAAPVSQKG